MCKLVTNNNQIIHNIYTLQLKTHTIFDQTLITNENILFILKKNIKIFMILLINDLFILIYKILFKFISDNDKEIYQITYENHNVIHSLEDLLVVYFKIYQTTALLSRRPLRQYI